MQLHIAYILYIYVAIIWYNVFMDEKRKLTVIEKTDAKVEETEVSQPQFSHPNQTNPIYKKLMNFKNSKVGAKLSIKDLLR